MGTPVASRPARRRTFLSQMRHAHGRTRLSDRPCCRHPHPRPPASALDRPYNRPGQGSRRPVGYGRQRRPGAYVRIRGGREAGTASPSPGRQRFPSWLRTCTRPAGHHHFLMFFSSSRPPAHQTSRRPASGTFHRSVPVMPVSRVAPRALVPNPDFDTPEAQGHQTILASWSRFVDESSYTPNRAPRVEPAPRPANVRAWSHQRLDTARQKRRNCHIFQRGSRK